MTIQHAIVAFPAFRESDTIESLRRAYDPQAQLLPAHVTFVFPFVAPLGGSGLAEHITSCLTTIEPFDVTFAPPSADADGWLFLRVTSGRDRVIDIHDRLYSGQLAPYLSRVHPYQPHVTLGRLHSSDALQGALAMAVASLPASLRARIDRVSLFCIEGQTGHVDRSFPLTR